MYVVCLPWGNSLKLLSFTLSPLFSYSNKKKVVPKSHIDLNLANGERGGIKDEELSWTHFQFLWIWKLKLFALYTNGRREAREKNENIKFNCMKRAEWNEINVFQLTTIWRCLLHWPPYKVPPTGSCAKNYKIDFCAFVEKCLRIEFQQIYLVAGFKTKEYVKYLWNNWERIKQLYRLTTFENQQLQTGFNSVYSWIIYSVIEWMPTQFG